MTRPLISDAVGVAITPLRVRESPKSVGVEFGLEGAETEGVSGLPSEEALKVLTGVTRSQSQPLWIATRYT